MRYVDLAIDYDNIKFKATRDGYGEALLLLGESIENVVAIGSDISPSVRVDWFRDKYPDRFISLGISEQNQIGVAAGLSLAGKIPYVTNFGLFLSGRGWDQIRTTVSYSNLNVKMGGAHGGISVGPDGATHQALEEIAIMRCIPNMTVIVPADYNETKKAAIEVSKLHGPTYIRFGREPFASITDEATPFEIGKAYCVREGTDVAFIACGYMVYESLVAANILAAEGISAMVVNNHTVKPLDVETIVEAAGISGAVVTAEEHQKAGGMGSAVVECLAENYPVPVKMVGVDDRFGESGAFEQLKEHYGLNSKYLAEAARNVIKMKLN